MIKTKLSAAFIAGLMLTGVTGLASATTLSTNMTVDNGFEFYLSTDDTVVGTLIASGNSWYNTYSFHSSLTPGTNHFIHVVAKDWGVVAGFIGDYSLSDNSFLFANGTQSLLTNTTDWTVYTDSFGGTSATNTVATYGWGVPSGVDPNADWIWTNSGRDIETTRYFSAEIFANQPVPEPATMLLFGTGLVGLVGFARRKKK